VIKVEHNENENVKEEVVEEEHKENEKLEEEIKEEEHKEQEHLEEEVAEEEHKQNVPAQMTPTSGKRGGESPFFKVRILPAVERNRVQGKTGYLLMDKDWDLEFAAMVDATRLLDLGELKEEFLEKSVFVWCGEEEGEGQWAVWNCWKLDEGAESDGRKKIVQFKDTLMALGKENLFFKWIELIQYESSQPGGFTPERQMQAADKAKLMFEEQGVDWEEFITASGGLDNLPGMEPQT